MDRRKSSVIVIPHVKWRKNSVESAFYPAADTDKFASLVKEILMDAIDQLTEVVNEN